MALLVAAFISGVVAFAATSPLRRLAVRFEILDHPNPRKSHRRPLPYLGGVAVLLGPAAGMAIFEARSLWLLVPLGLMCLLGVYDDVRHASVTGRLVAEASIALSAMAFGFTWHITDSVILNAAITLIWL